MKIAIPHWNRRISPVFDVACNVLLVDIADGCEKDRRELYLQADSLAGRINTLVESGAEVLVCGAISKPLEMGLAARGVKIIPQICGDIEQVLAGYISGNFDPNAFLMPGCCGRRQFRNRNRSAGSGGGRSRESQGNCLCPGCGHSSPHIPAQPCNQQTCPNCGTKMIRN